jgi:hypothetical protein
MTGTNLYHPLTQAQHNNLKKLILIDMVPDEPYWCKDYLTDEVEYIRSVAQKGWIEFRGRKFYLEFNGTASDLSGQTKFRKTFLI